MADLDMFGNLRYYPPTIQIRATLSTSTLYVSNARKSSVVLSLSMRLQSDRYAAACLYPSKHTLRSETLEYVLPSGQHRKQ